MVCLGGKARGEKTACKGGFVLIPPTQAFGGKQSSRDCRSGPFWMQSQGDPGAMAGKLVTKPTARGTERKH